MKIILKNLKFHLKDYNKAINQQPVFDDDSIEMRILSQTTDDATGSYNINVDFRDGTTGDIISNKVFTITVTSSNILPSDEPTYKTYSNIFNVNLQDESDINTESTSNVLVKGQISIIRFKLIIDEDKRYNIKFLLTTTLQNDQFQIQNFFLSFIGDNLPCTTRRPATYTMADNYAYSAELDLKFISKYSEIFNDINQDSLIIEAFILIPEDSEISDESTASFTIDTYIDNQNVLYLSKTISSLTVKPSSYLTRTPTTYITVI